MLGLMSGLMSPLMSGLIRKNRLPARIRGWAGTATGRHIHVVTSHIHPPKELIQAQKYLLGKKTKWSSKDDQLGACAGASQVPHEAKDPAVTSRSKTQREKQLRAAENSEPDNVQIASVTRSELEVCVRRRILKCNPCDPVPNV